jgi:predicted O-methyltransferase YrrM
MVRQVLDRLFEAADLQESSPRALSLPPGFSIASGPARVRSDAMATIYMPISPRGGDLLYALVRAARPERVVEFGTSFGISTIYLAAAVADNGAGHVFSTELSARKVEAARGNLVRVGLSEHATVLEGDALETLGDVAGPIAFVLLDGWKDLYLPILRLLEPRLAPGALVLADDAKQRSVHDYLTYVRDPANGYVSVSFPVDDGMEVSCHSTVATRDSSACPIAVTSASLPVTP